MQCLEGARSGASLSRIQSVLPPLEAWQAGDKGAIDDSVALAPRSHRRGTCERDLTLQGSGGSDGVSQVHDETFRMSWRMLEGAKKPDCK